MNLVQQVLALREGGQTIRCHTIPQNGSYNVAVHSFNAVNLLLLLYPGEPSRDLVKAILWHDVPERWTGDVPAPAKWASPLLKTLLDSLEKKIMQKLGFYDCFKNLTEDEKAWLRGVDLLELYIWALEQPNFLGNRYSVDIAQKVYNLLMDKPPPKEILDFVKGFTIARLPELDELLKEGTL